MQVFDVFISYRRDDGTETAEKVFEFLKAKGLRVFFDNKGGIEAGHEFDRQIDEQLVATPNYILIGSKEAFRFRNGMDWVRHELSLALKHYKKNGNRTITIVLPEGSEIPPEDTLPKELKRIARFQAISITKPGALDEVLTAVTAVSHANLWHASHRWLENEKKPGGRFCNMQVDESLLPSASVELPSNVICGDYDTCDLLEAVQREFSHTYIFGQGGIGKTTSLLKLMNEAYEGKVYSESAVVPLFVELSAAPDTPGRLYQGGSSSFIRRSIYRQIRNDKSVKQVREAAVEELDSVFTQPYETVVAPLEKLLSRDSQTPQYLLLLDGLNEISTVQIEEDGPTVSQMVIEEIRHLARNCPNVRIVLTSRSRELSIEEENFIPLELAGISEDVIYQYLARKNCDLNLRPELLKILRIPLFLIMYAELSSGDGICTQGEILHRFFSHRKTEEYTILSHVDDMTRSVKKSASASSKNRITPQMHSFLLDFVLPEIGWYMEQKEIFHIPGCYLYEVIWNVLANREDTDICGRFGMHLFYPDVTTAAVADVLIQRLGGDSRQVCEHITKLLTFTLGLLKRTERGYAFTHQHIRDYFAARKCINALKLATQMYDIDLLDAAYDYMESVFGGRSLDLVAQRFIGEILQEYRNIPVEEENGWFLPSLTGERELVTQALDIYRDRFPSGKGLVSLVEILKMARKNLAGCDFSRLDLSNCRLSGATLSVGDLQADFTQTLIRGETLIHTGHTGYVNTVNYATDGSYVLTGGNDGKVLRYHVATGQSQLLASLAGPVWYAKILSDGTLLTLCEGQQRNQFFGCEKVIVQRINLQTGEGEKQLEVPGGFFRIQLSADEKLLLIRQSGTLQVVCAETLEILRQHTLGEQNYVFVFLGKSYEILLSDGNAMDVLTGQKRQFLSPREESSYITYAAVHGNTLCAMSDEGSGLVRLEIFRLKDGKLLKSFLQSWRTSQRFDYYTLNYNATRYLNLFFSNEGKWLAMITPNDVYIFETKTWQLCQCLQNMMGEYINDVSFFDRDRRMAVGTLGGAVYLCETAGFTPVSCARGIPCRVRQMDISANGEYMITLSADGMLRCWNLQTGLLTAMRFIGRKLDFFVDITEDGKLVQVSDNDCYYYYTLPDLLPFTGLRVQPDYSLVKENEDGKYQIHICKYGVRQYTVCGRDAQICDPYLFVTGWADGYFRACYDLATGQPLWGHSKVDPSSLEAGNDRFQLISSMNRLETYDSATGEFLGSMERDIGWHKKKLYGDCLYIYEGLSTDNITHIFRLPEFEPVAEIPGHIFFSEDGKWVQVENATQYGWGQLDIYQLSDRTPVASFSLIADEILLSNGSGRSYVPVRNNCFAVCSSEETVCVYRLAEGTPAACSLIGEYALVPGLEVLDVDLSDLHPDSRITPHQEELLRTYGAIL